MHGLMGTNPSFKALGEHNNSGEPFLPNHPPKVVQSVWKRTYDCYQYYEQCDLLITTFTLCSNIGTLFLVALYHNKLRINYRGMEVMVPYIQVAGIDVV